MIRWTRPDRSSGPNQIRISELDLTWIFLALAGVRLSHRFVKRRRLSHSCQVFLASSRSHMIDDQAGATMEVSVSLAFSEELDIVD